MTAAGAGKGVQQFTSDQCVWNSMLFFLRSLHDRSEAMSYSQTHSHSKHSATGPYGNNVIEEQEARSRFKRSYMKAANKLLTHIQRHYAADIAIREFRASAYSKLVLHLFYSTRQ